jgi:BarA-like signal transduction histidine kinase
MPLVVAAVLLKPLVHHRLLQLALQEHQGQLAYLQELDAVLVI